MTLADRISLIDRTVRSLERHNPYLEPSALLETASTALALNYGLVVTPDEITRVLSALAEPLH